VLYLRKPCHQGGTKNALQARKDYAPKQQLEEEASKQGNNTCPIEQVVKLVVASTGSMRLALAYIPRSHCKEDESPFSECTRRSIKTKATKKYDGASITTLKGSVTVLTLKMWQSKVSSPLFPGSLFLLKKAMACQVHRLRRI